MKQVPMIIRIVAKVLLLFLVTSRLFAEAELKGTPAELAKHLADLPRMVTVTGESQLKVQADRGIVSLRVVTENRLLQEALRQNQEVRSKISNTLQERGIAPERIQPSRFSSTPKHAWFSEKPKSHRVENMVKVTVQDEKEFQVVAGLADTFSEVHYLGVDFETSNKEALKLKVVNQALANAAERKSIYEEKLGVRLLPRSFSEHTSSGNVPIMRPAEPPRKTGGSSPQRVTPIAGRGGEDLDDEPSSSFDEHTFRALVTVEYAVETK